MKDLNGTMALSHLMNGINRQATACHNRIPGLRKLPLRAVGIIFALVLANVLVWVAVGIVLVTGGPFVVLASLITNTLIALSCVSPYGIKDKIGTVERTNSIAGTALLLLLRCWPTLWVYGMLLMLITFLYTAYFLVSEPRHG